MRIFTLDGKQIDNEKLRQHLNLERKLKHSIEQTRKTKQQMFQLHRRPTNRNRGR